MSIYKQVRNIIEEILSDGKEHSIKEFKDKCENKGISLETNKNAISNTLFKMKNEGIISAGEERGGYRMGTAEKEDIDIKRVNDENLEKIDWNRFFVLKPKRLLYNEKKITITERGEIRLNSVLHKEIQCKAIEFIFSNDCREVILNLNGGNSHKMTKAGTTKNKEIVEKLKKNGIEIPAFYEMKWDKDIEMWRGILNV